MTITATMPRLERSLSWILETWEERMVLRPSLLLIKIKIRFAEKFYFSGLKFKIKEISEPLT